MARQYKRAHESFARCSTCDGKRIFPSRLEAERAILQAKIARNLRGVNKRREVRVYACPVGLGFHVTSWAAPGRPGSQ